jgi:antitoxin component of MazEF toxin-antitoxin module
MANELKIIRMGNSAGIILPAWLMRIYKLEIGDKLTIEFEYPRFVLKRKDPTKEQNRQ